jgi:alanine dehydrogenase
MEIGIPKETKDQEFRVGLTPSIVRTLVDRGHQVYLETDAGLGSSFPDLQYLQAGAKIVPTAADVWHREMVVKVKEPLATEYSYLQKNQILFTYLHLAANRTLTEQLIDSRVTAIAYETVELPDGKLPLLSPMSIIAGRLSIQFGARFLEKQQGGSGVLLGGVPGVQPGHVTILGGGIVGTEAARMAVGMGAQVTILDVNIDRLNYLETIFGARVTYLYSNATNIETAVRSADLVIGAVLIPGKRAPILVSSALVAQMKTGAVIIDVAVDQGGCIETLRPTSHTHPVYTEAGVVHYGVPNMPGAVPWTATQALTNSTAPYVVKLADRGLAALSIDPSLAKGLNIRSGRIVHPAVQEVFADLPSG